MSKRMYQKNPGHDDDWMVGGEPDEGDFEELGRKKVLSGIEFDSVLEFPSGVFRHLAGLRRLKNLSFRSCCLTDDDMADVASFEKIESLWIEDCAVTDAGVAYLEKHPRLWRVVIMNTRITDVSLQHLVTISNLKWLWLDGTDVTDRGLAYLAAVVGLESLALRDTAITDKGILRLSGLPKLGLSLGHVRNTGVTDKGIDALFAAQQAAIKARRAAKKCASTTSADKKAKKKSAVTLDPQEIESARRALYGFFGAMNEWGIQCVKRFDEAERQSPDEVVANEVWKACQEDCRKVFDQYCTPKKRDYGRPENISVGGPPDYMADPDQEPITAIETPTRRRILIETKQEFGVEYRCQYVLLKKGDKWLIDNKKFWDAGWKWTIL